MQDNDSFHEGRGLATSELTLRQHTRSSVFSDLVQNGFNNNNNKLKLIHLKNTTITGTLKPAQKVLINGTGG